MADATTTAAPQLPQELVRSKQIIDQLWNDPTYGAAVRAKAVELFPDIKDKLPETTTAPIIKPLADKIDATAASVAKILERMDADLKERTERDTEAQFKTKVDAAVARFNLTDDGVQKVYAHMKETGNYTDVMGAAAFIAANAPKPTQTSNPPSWLPKSMNLFGSQKADEAFADLHRNPQAYMDAQLQEWARDPEAYVRETLGTAA
jgi:hypothetical protein